MSILYAVYEEYKNNRNETYFSLELGLAVNKLVVRTPVVGTMGIEGTLMCIKSVLV